MLAIFPIFIDEDDLFWSSRTIGGLIEKTICEALRSEYINEVCVFSNSRLIKQLLTPLNLTVSLVELSPQQHENGDIFPEGTIASLIRLKKSDKNLQEDFIILDFRNFLLKASIIDDAVRYYFKINKKGLMSVKDCIDHPCQLKGYYDLMDFGIIHFFDNVPIEIFMEEIEKKFSALRNQGKKIITTSYNVSDKKTFRITKPFFFDWKGRGIEPNSHSKLYIPTYEGFETSYMALEDFQTESTTLDFPLFYIYDGSSKARILMPLEDRDSLKNSFNIHNDYSVIGASFSYNAIKSLIIKERSCSEFSILFRSPDYASDRYLIRIFPINGLDHQEAESVERETDKPAISFLVDENAGDYSCIVYFVFRVVHNGTCEIVEEFQNFDNFWACDPITGKKFNTENGMEITGRQDFPEIFQPDGSLFILNEKMAFSFEQEMAKGNIYSYCLNESQSIKVNSCLDLLRYKSIKKAQGVSAHQAGNL